MPDMSMDGPHWDDLPTISPQDLLRIALQVVERWPQARLVKNMVGNLTVLTPDGSQPACLDLRYGVIEPMED